MNTERARADDGKEKRIARVGTGPRTDKPAPTPIAIKHKPRYCFCGCGDTVPDTRQFKQGHDAKLKSILTRVISGKLSPAQIPQEAWDRQSEIAFLEKRPELKAAFAMRR